MEATIMGYLGIIRYIGSKSFRVSVCVYYVALRTPTKG